MYEQRISGPKRREGGGGRAQRACNDAVGLTKLMHERVHHDLRESAYIMCVHEACEADHHESIGDARLIEVEAVKLQAGFPPSLQVRLSNNCSLWLTIRVCSAQMCVLGGGGTGGVEGKIWRGEANERSRPRATDPLVVGGGGGKRERGGRQLRMSGEHFEKPDGVVGPVTPAHMHVGKQESDVEKAARFADASAFYLDDTKATD